MDADMGVKAKVSGYLEKKGKLKVMSSYKKYWFVLEDRLLLYYRSKDEYGSLSPCKGSINLGPNCTLKPCSSQVGVFQIETRTNTITLRADSREEQNRWMHAIMSSLNQNNPNPTRLSHFRYSMDEISKIEVQETNKDSDTPSSAESSNEPDLIKKLQKLGAQSYITPNVDVFLKRKPLSSSSSSLRSSYIDYESGRQKSLSTSKLSTIDIEESIVNNDLYGTTKTKYRSLSMERLPSIIIEDNQYKANHIYERLPSRNSLIINDLYEKTDVIYAEPIIKPQEKTKKDEKPVYEEPKFDLNENVMEDIDDHEDDRKKKKSKKKEKSKEKKEGLIHRVLKRRSKKVKNRDEKDKEEEENIYEEMPIKMTTDLPDKDKIEILHELHHILERKKTLVKKLPDPIPEPKMEVNTLYDYFKKDDSEGPLLPLKHQPQLGHSPFHDVPKNIPVGKVPIPPKKKKLQTMKSVDQILDDLENEEVKGVKPGGKVKKLVKQFSTNTMPKYMEQVQIRKKTVQDLGKKRYSDELTMLLDQLAQVTSAPLLTPGTTTSLVVPNLTDDELLKLLPIRRRRMSEPDYDIPRSHVSLTNLPKEVTESPIQATRFFGPVLTNQNCDSSPGNSITPDSLEADLDVKSQHPPVRTQFSLDEDYSSHHYPKLDIKKQNSFDLGVIYAEPKKKNQFTMTYKSEKKILVNDVNRINDMFIDSLELAESATPF